MLLRRGCQSQVATTLLLIVLTGCGVPDAQTPDSRSAFALFEQVQKGARGDLPSAARAAGLADEGVCREVGAGGLYCNAVRITDADYIVEAPFAPQFIFDYDELRFCLAQGRAAGFRAEGKGYYIPWLLYREYPEEFASIARESVIGAEPDPNDPKRTYFQTVSSMKDLGLEPSVRSLGYGGSGSDFRLQDDRTYFAYYYPSHTEGERGCAVF